MARIAIDVTPVHFQRAKSLVDAGVYESIQQFGEIAFANQLALEGGADPEDLAQQARGRRSGSGSPEPASRKRIPRLPPKEKEESTGSRELPGPAGDQAAPPAMAFDVAVARLSVGSGLAERVQAVETAPAPRDQKIFALINKPFALKLVARAVLVNAVDGWPRVEHVAPVVGNLAAAITKELAAEDRAAERTRNLFHTGLPTYENAESLDRFTVQYLGRVARSGQVAPGALGQFALASVFDGRIALSTAGVDLACLPNPVLDGGQRPWEGVMSPTEQAFVVNHVMQFVPGEAHDARTVISAVESGNDRPESLLVAVQKSLPSAWKDVQARSYLSGLVTRLCELHVLNRVWEGRTVHYVLGPNASAVVHAAEPQELAS